MKPSSSTTLSPCRGNSGSSRGGTSAQLENVPVVHGAGYALDTVQLTSTLRWPTYPVVIHYPRLLYTGIEYRFTQFALLLCFPRCRQYTTILDFAASDTGQGDEIRA